MSLQKAIQRFATQPLLASDRNQAQIIAIDRPSEY